MENQFKKGDLVQLKSRRLNPNEPIMTVESPNTGILIDVIVYNPITGKYDTYRAKPETIELVNTP